MLGNQKTGTSAIAHLLADCCGLSKQVDIRELWYPVIGRILRGELELSTVIREHPKPFSRGLIKEPLLTFIYDEVKCVFPDARFVLITRDPRANIRSLLNRMGLPGDLPELRVSEWSIPAQWEAVFQADLWQTSYTHYVDILADRWNRAADVYLEHPAEMLLVRYEDFTADKVGVIGELARKLDLKQTKDISREVDVQFQPRGRHDISWRDFFGAKNLTRIERVCSSRMKAYGYSEAEA